MSIEGISGAVASVEESSQTAVAEGLENTQTAEIQEPAKQETQEPDKFAAKFAALTRKEKQLRQQEQYIATKVAEAEKRAKEAEERAAQFGNLENDVKGNPLKWLQDKYGITYEQLTEMALNEGNPTQEMRFKRMQEEMDSKYSKQIEDMKRLLEEKEQTELNKKAAEAKNGFLKETTEFIDSNEDKYELIRLNDAYNLVYDVAEEVFNNNVRNFEEEYGRKPSQEEAFDLIPDKALVADAVEADLETEASKVLKAKKLQQKLQPPKSESQKTAPTLSNTAASQVPKNGERKLSNDESLAAAAKLIKWIE